MTASRRPEPALQVLTVLAGGDTYGLPIGQVQTIFDVGAITPIPLGPPAILGLVNLRGSIIPALSLRLRLGLPKEPKRARALAVGLELGPEAFALLVDGVGDVVTLSAERQLPLPSHVGDPPAAMIAAVYRLEHGLIPVLDIAALASCRPSASDLRRPAMSAAKLLPSAA